MTSDGAPGDIDYLAYLARESARFAEVLQQTRSDKRVPTCPDWDADDLIWHLAEVQWFWGSIVGRGLTDYADVQTLDSGGRPGEHFGLVAFYRQATSDLHQNLSSASPDQAAWTWSDEQTVGFIRRRQAHEALIHRLDAELTARDRTPMDPVLSTDGVDEVLRIMYTGVPSWGQFAADPNQTIRFHTTDTGSSWLVTLGQFTGTNDDGTTYDKPHLEVAVSDLGDQSAASVSGTAADLDCWLWNRPPQRKIERDGNPMVLARLDEILAEGIA
ncbi:MAG: hypothetical protein QOE58_3132 [Actinomycetota bacterium]|jgi:uncharacterized protein (TIGR03083 family)|nr:hypothetical protein [Actinomycetota bacterium]